MNNTLIALCLILFMSGCVKTETIIRVQEVAVLPPAYLCEAEPKPMVPEGLPADERTDYLLEAYASRGDAMDRAAERAALFDKWTKAIKELYPGSVEKPLEDLEAEADDPK